jgi:hypothetical protein
MSALLEASLNSSVRFLVPAVVLAQAWRDGIRQARLPRFLKTPAVEVLPWSEAQARAAGVLCGLSGARMSSMRPSSSRRGSIAAP